MNNEKNKSGSPYGEEDGQDQKLAVRQTKSNIKVPRSVWRSTVNYPQDNNIHDDIGYDVVNHTHEIIYCCYAGR